MWAITDRDGFVLIYRGGSCEVFQVWALNVDLRHDIKASLNRRGFKVMKIFDLGSISSLTSQYLLWMPYAGVYVGVIV